MLRMGRRRVKRTGEGRGWEEGKEASNSVFHPCSDEESSGGNPLIAADEDLSSPEEVETTPPAPKHSTKKPIAPESEEESEEDFPTPEILQPTQAPLVPKPTKAPMTSKPSSKPKAVVKPLKSALDIELTESEEQESAEDEGPSVSSKKPQSNGGHLKNLEDIFEPSPLLDRKKESKGLMLQFSSTPPTKPAAKTSKSDSLLLTTADPAEESPDQRRRDKKKKKSKKKRHDSDETSKSTMAAASSSVPIATTTSGGGDVGGGPADPYGAIASLDAWLNSDTTTIVSVPCFPQYVPVSQLICTPKILNLYSQNTDSAMITL